MKTVVRILLIGIVALPAVAAQAMAPPRVGEAAPNFSLPTLDGKSIELKAAIEQNPVVLVVLRGWPGYQCPLCERQVRDFSAHAAEFESQGVRVLMVYPGPAEVLQARARELLNNKAWPKEFLFTLDPEYAFTNRYGLRWDAKNETAYPSTFLIDREGIVRFAQVSRTHGGRVKAVTVLEAVRELRSRVD